MSIKEKTKAIVVIGLLLLIPVVFVFAVMILLNHYRASYLLLVSFATVSLTIAVILPFRQKRISFQAILLLVIAILFIASGTFQYANDNFIRPLAVLQQIEFSKSLRLNQVSDGLADTGMGVALLSIGSALTKLKPPKDDKQKKLWLMFIFGMGIYWLISGISSVFSGLLHL